MRADLSTCIGNIYLPSPLYNASGVWCTDYTQLDIVLNNIATGAVVTKSCTLKPREGNPNPRYFDKINKLDALSASINSMGLPNKGIDYYLEVAAHIENPKHKPFFLSVCGLSVEENLQILQNVVSYEHSNRYINGIELNLSCPNIIGKPQLGYDFPALTETLRKIFEINALDKYTVGIKLPPYFEEVHWGQATDVIEPYAKSSHINFLTCCNSIGNGLVIDYENESTVIKPKYGHGGIGGDYIKPIALANVRQFYNTLGNKLDIIGCGGVKSGRDAFEHILAGASAVQVGTSIQLHGPDQFKLIFMELEDIMTKKGYVSLNSFKGKLKYL